MELSWSVDGEDGVTLVRCRLHNDAAVTRRVRLRSRLDGPVLPPRTRGIPEPGWDADGATIRLDPGERRALGFASPAPEVDPPVEIDVVDATTAGDDGREPDAATAVRELGSYRPPRDAIVEHSDDQDRRKPTADDTDDDSPGRETHSRSASELERPPDSGEESTRTSADRRSNDLSDEDDRNDERGDTAVGPTSPDRIDDWLDAVERRIERGERLVDADVSTATEVVATAGGVKAIADLDGRLDDDAERLRRLGDRASELAARAERADVPTAALRRLS
ncbi:hypothetical protein [Halorubrum sp. DTA98]|uniref:DUF7857 domain-containing protein n=1 Tax=Halorubrum sp. DTA98 TaxID=3402163 RepID=UPI003AB03C3D